MSASPPFSPTGTVPGQPAAGEQPTPASEGSDPAPGLSQQASAAAAEEEAQRAAAGHAVAATDGEADPAELELEDLMADLQRCMSEAGDGLGQVQALRSWKNSHFSQEALAEAQRELQEVFAGMGPEGQRIIDQFIAMAELAKLLNSCTERVLDEAEDFMLPKRVPQPPPGAGYLEARLRRAAALSPDQRGPDEAAFLEAAQLCREVCELLPLAPSGRPGLPTILTAFVLPTIELALAKLWQALDLCPYGCAPVCNANLWEPLKVYLEHRMPPAVANLIKAIGMAGPHSATEGTDTQASSGGERGSGGSGSGSGSSGSGSSSRPASREATTACGGRSGSSSSSRPASPEATTACGGRSGSSSSSDGESDGSAEPVGPHGVYVRSALRVALLLATNGRCCQFPLVGARLLRAAIDIASDPECAAAMDSRLADLATRWGEPHTPLRLTARQLCRACYASLAHLDTISHPGPEPTQAAGMAQLPLMSMTPAEMRAEVHAAAADGAAGLLQLEPHSARALLLAAYRLYSGQPGGASVQSVEQCMQAVQAARQQGSRLQEVHAAAQSLWHTMVLLAGPDAGSMEGSTDDELDYLGSGGGDSSGQAGGPGGALQRMLSAASCKKPSGKGAGAKRRQQRSAARQYQELQREVAEAVETAPSLTVEAVQAVLDAFRRGGGLLKACKQLLPDQWVRQASQAWHMVQPLEAAVQAFLDDAQRSGSSTVSTGRRHAQALGLPMAQAAVRSGNCSHVLDVLRELGVELQSALSCMQSVAYMRQHFSSLTPTCSGCGAVAVGLRKCSACKRAQYCSAECQKRHWPSHKAECRAAAGASGSGG